MQSMENIVRDHALPGDSTDDVRATLAQLTARARRLIGNSEENVVALNSRGVYEVSKRAADTLLQQSATAPSPHSLGSSQASVELFMARNFGFDLQEQQGLIHQLQRSHAELAVDSSTSAISGPRASPYENGLESGTGVDTVINTIKHDLISQAHRAVYQKEQEDIRSRSHELLKAAWKSFYMTVSDDLDGLAVSVEHQMHQGKFGEVPVRQAAQKSLGADARSRNLLEFVSSDSPLSLEINKEIAGFAQIVEHCSPLEWVSHFTSYVVEKNTNDARRDISVLWATVHALLQPIIRQGSAASFLSYVSSSREVIEHKFRNRLLTSGVRIDPERIEELENVSAERFYELTQRKVSGNAWAQMYSLMKAGRYDAAVLAARQTGSAALEEALQRLRDASPLERQRMPPLLSVSGLYDEDATQDDPFRKASLFVLLAGRTGEAEAIIESTLVTLSSKVSSSLEDVLWLRLVCIRNKEETTNGGNVQSLEYMQKAIIDDLQDLVQVVHGSIPRLASFLFHAILPARGLRLLLDNVLTHVDGLHMALCFNASNLLTESALESIDLGRHISRYCSMMLLTGAQYSVSKERELAAACTFSYFQKTGFLMAFVEFAQKDVIWTRLFGQRTASETSASSGILIERRSSKELWKAMNMIAEEAARRNNFPMALRTLVSITESASKSGRSREHVCAALSRAVQIACPALSQVFYLSLQSSDAGAVIVEASRVLSLLQLFKDLDTVSITDYNTLSTLCAMADVYLAAENSQWELALCSFFRLPFVPSSSTNTDIEPLVHAYCSSSPHVIAAGGAILPLAFRAATHVLSEGTQTTEAEGLAKCVALRQQMCVVTSWIRRLCSQSGHTFSEVPQEVYDFEERFLST